MKKKIIGICLCMLMIGSTMPFLGFTHESRTSVLASIGNETQNCGCDSQPTLRDTQPLIHPAPHNETATLALHPLGHTDLPASFSWRDKNGTDWTTPAKDQGNCGSCWDFAALGCLESIIQIREGCAALDVDLSEQYVLSCLHNAGSCKGGGAYYAYRYIKHSGIIPEFCFPYQINDKIPCANQSPDSHDFLINISTYGYWRPDGSAEDRDQIKTEIMDSGPVVAAMLFTYNIHGPDNLEEWGYTHHNPEEYYPYTGPVQGINHQVVIVGWKDDAAIANGGYWIVKNSLSEEWGYDGYFNIEYGSLNIDKSEIDWVDYNTENFSNWMPIAKTEGPYQGHINQDLTFNGSTSFDHEGMILTYAWDLGDGTHFTGATVTHAYTVKGVYPVTLTVVDNQNNTGTQSTWAYIDTENHAPNMPTLKGRKSGTNGTAYRYTFSAVDPDGDDVYYYLNWGDTYWDGGAVGWIGPYKSGEKVTLEKTWVEKGNYTVRVKAKDGYGAKSEWATLPVAMPISNALSSHWFWEWLFERFPYAFPFLRYLLSY